MTAYTTIPVAKARADDDHDCGCGCPCGCAPCPGGCGLECLERPRYFCGQLLTDADLQALVEWTRARLALVRHREGWGVVCGLDVRCDPRSPSSVVIGEGYAVSCCGGDIVLCKPALVDLSSACRSPKSLCDDPCAPKPEPPDDVERTPWDCPEGVWVDLLIDAADENAAGRATLSTDGCRRFGTCEASRVRETYSVTVRQPSAGDPLARAEARWLKQYEECFGTLEESGLPDAPDDENEMTLGELRMAVERFALDHACEGRCRALRWICAPGAARDDTRVPGEVVQRVRLALLLDCLVALGRCDCQTCAPGEAVMLARVLVAPGATEDCPCRVVIVDDAPPYRRPLGLDCPPARLGRVNLGDLIGQRPQVVCRELALRGVRAISTEPVNATRAMGLLNAKFLPIFDCGQDVGMLVVDDECLGERVVGFVGSRRRPIVDPGPQVPEAQPVPEGVAPQPAEPAAAPANPLFGIDGMTENRIERLAELKITSLEHLAAAATGDLRTVFPGTKLKELQAIKAQARALAEGGE